MRLNVTDLESYRYFKNREDADLDKLLHDLAHVSPPNRKMQAGSAMAKFFEHAEAGPIDQVQSEGWTFYFNIEGDWMLPCSRELKIEQVFNTTVGPVTLSGKVDSFTGLTVRDQKLTEQFEVEDKYTDSLQWRAYLVMLHGVEFFYDIFVGKVSEHDNSVAIREYHPVCFYAYPSMLRDVESAVNELAEVAKKYEAQIEAIKRGA
jgi:hypothetical protein